MKVTIIPTVIDALGTVSKWLTQGLEDLEIKGRVEIIQTTALLTSARILRRVQKTWGNLLSLKLQGKTISYVDVKNSQWVKIIIIFAWRKSFLTRAICCSKWSQIAYLGKYKIMNFSILLVVSKQM